jgi:hypothetical protein
MQARHFEPVLQDDSETVAVLETERDQSAGDARDLLIPGRISCVRQVQQFDHGDG